MSATRVLTLAALALLVLAAGHARAGGGAGGGYGGGGGVGAAQGGGLGGGWNGWYPPGNRTAHRPWLGTRGARVTDPEPDATGPGAATAAGTAVITAGALVLLLLKTLRRGYDIATVSLSLRRRRHYAQTIRDLLRESDFSTPRSRARVARALSAALAGEDLDAGRARVLGLRLSADRAGPRAQALAKRREEHADVEVSYAPGGHAERDAPRTDEERPSDRCVVSVVAAAPRAAIRRLERLRGDQPLDALCHLAHVGRWLEGLWICYAPAPHEALHCHRAAEMLVAMEEADARCVEGAHKEEARAGRKRRDARG